ncbi:hypothetical protein [Ekhidna sp.]
MKDLKKIKTLRTLLVVLGFAVCSLIMIESINQKSHGLATTRDSYDSLKNTVKTHRNLIANTYLIGITLFKETVD